VSLASRRRRRDYSNPDDVKSSIVGLSGWLFADLLLAIAIVFLVASDKPTKILAGNPDDKFDVTIEFSESEDGPNVVQTAQIDERFDIWVTFSEPVFTNSFTETDLMLEPNDEWSVRFLNRSDSDAQKTFQIRFNPESSDSSSLTLSIKQGSVRSAESENSYNAQASLAISITNCRTLKGIAVNPEETALFKIPNGANFDRDRLKKWLEDESGKAEDHKVGSPDFGFGTAKLIAVELEKPIDQRRQMGFAILFGGYNRDSEVARDGANRARNMQGIVRRVLQDLGLLAKKTSGSGSNVCPIAAEIPIRPFGDGSFSKDDLKFELYFYENE